MSALKQYLDQFSHFCTAHECNQQTDRHPDRLRYSIYSNRPHLAIAAMQPNNSSQSKIILYINSYCTHTYTILRQKFHDFSP